MFVCQETVCCIDTSMSGDVALQPPQTQQSSQHLLAEPVRPGSGQVTPVFGKTSWGPPCLYLCPGDRKNCFVPQTARMREGCARRCSGSEL
jgi:hypothetical protein